MKNESILPLSQSHENGNDPVTVNTRIENHKNENGEEYQVSVTTLENGEEVRTMVSNDLPLHKKMKIMFPEI